MDYEDFYINIIMRTAHNPLAELQVTFPKIKKPKVIIYSNYFTLNFSSKALYSIERIFNKIIFRNTSDLIFFHSLRVNKY